MSDSRQAITQEAARIICEEWVLDYGAAKRKALERLRLPPRTPLPDNRAVQDAVLEYQQLFGGADYHEHLRHMRETALQIMATLSAYSPMLAGGAVSGAVTAAHHVQIHAFADKAEMIEIDLFNRGIHAEQDERRYRYPDGREAVIPLARFQWRGQGVDVVVFPEAETRRPPVNPTDGLAYQRLPAADVRQLLVP